MVGIEVLHQCLADQSVTNVVVIGRRPSRITHEKLLEIKHENFLDFADIEPVLSDADICFYCLGVYQNRVSRDKFWEVTVGYLEALLRSLGQVNTGIVFSLFSTQGADTEENSWFLFGNAKGRAEKRLTESNLRTKYIFRPGFINPGIKSGMSGISLWLLQLIYKIFPFIGIDAKDLAKAMVHVSLLSHQATVFENRDIRKIINGITLKEGR